MTRNRIVQLVALLVAAACLAGSTWITFLKEHGILDQRQELQLSASDDVQEKLPPQVAVATAALGSFRGLAVDVMWYRLEMLKRDGKFHEANTLSQWITTLQPRFPQVWSFMAWNMAYNISVATYTPDERLAWVTKGIDLLRDKGIPFNPYAIRLYRELGWIFFHKVGQYSDDQHWYYKQRLAQEWQEVVGNAAEGGTTRQIIEAFRPIADAYDAYVNQQRPTRQALAELAAVAAANPALAPQLQGMDTLALKAFERRLTRLRESLRRDQPSQAARLDPLAELIARQVKRSDFTPSQLLVQADPEAGAIVQELTSLKLPPGEQTLRRLGQLRMVLDSADARTLGVLNAAPDDPVDRRIVELFAGDTTRDAMTRAMAFYRALVISERYHMDPNWMLHLMEYYGPVDWRHASAHSLYWSSLGVRMAVQLRNKKDVDFLNTVRQVIHSLQQLTRVGRTTFDPWTGHIDELPDPRFVAAYEQAVWDAGEEIQKDVWGSGTVESFDAGYENFLIDAVRTSYLYGDLEQAREYYRKAREKFSDQSHNVRSGQYLLPLDAFVTKQFVEDIDMMSVVRPVIDGFLQQGLAQGLANNRVEVYERFRSLAQSVHARYQARAIANPTAVQDRMAMRPFKEIEENTYIGFMVAERMDMLVRMRVWRNTPIVLKLATYERMLPELSRQTQAAQVDLDRAFPQPPGLLLRERPAAERKADEAIRPAEGVEVERQ